MKHYIKSLIICLLLIPQFNVSGQEKNFVSDSIKADILYQKGRAFSRNQNYAEAIKAYLQSLQIRNKINNGDFISLARSYYALAIVYKNIESYNQAIRYSQLAELNYIKAYGKNASGLALIYNNLGNVYKKKLNYKEALKYFNQTINIYKSQDEINKTQIEGVYYSIADVYYLMDKNNEAIQIALEHLNNANNNDKLFYYELLAATYQDLKMNDEAIHYFQKAIELSSQLFPEEKSYDVAFEYLNYAGFLGAIGETNKALKTINKAKPIIFSNGNKKGYFASLYFKNLGIIAENKHIESQNLDIFKLQNNKNLLEAIEYYKKALEALNFPADISSETSLDSLHNISNTQCIDLLQLIGNKYINISSIYEGDNPNKYIDNIYLALNYYKTASSFVQKLRKEISGDDNKITLASLQQSTFTEVVKTAYLAYKSDNNFGNLNLAFINAERLKSGSIFDKLEETMAKDNSLIPDSLLSLEDYINRNITSYNEKLFDERNRINPDSSLIDSLKAVLNDFDQQRLDLNNYLENNYSDYYELKYSSSLFNVDDIQHQLKNDEVIIEYVLNETDTLPELYSILIEPNNAKFIKQNIDSQFIKSIESAFHFMSTPKYMYTTNEDAKAYCRNSYDLYQKLIKPYENEIRDKKIIIVPDGKLNYIAFDALIDEMPDTTKNIRFNNLNYLIKKNCINYTYSANLLYKFDDLSRKANKSVLAFAPEYQTDTFTFENQKMVLMPLPGVKKEVDNISHEVKTKVFEGKDATEINFRKNVENYDILHLAMHAFINDSLPAFSRLAFTQNTGKQPDDDGWLNTADIYNLNLNARLTVLSACNTGTGKLQKGEGVMSLARGFLYAGCPSIIMTLWEAEDNSGTKIMSSFYKYLKKGKPKDEALRLAKLDYINNANPRLAHPHYWLSYVTIGNSTPLYRSYDFYFFGLLILAFIGITTEQILRIKKARKKRT